MTRSLCHTLILHRTEPALLAVREAGRWSLPVFEPDAPGFRTVTPLVRSVRESLGLDIAVLRCLRNEYVPSIRGVARAYVAESLDPAWRPPAGMAWVEPNGLSGNVPADPWQADVVDRWVREGDNPLRVPWAGRGWFDQASRWTRHTLDRLGYRVTGPVEQVRSWTVSTVMSVTTDRGTVYFKASPPMFAHEPVLTRALAERFPAHVPRVLAVDVERHWMLMADFGATTLAEIEDEAVWREALGALARVQCSQVRAHGTTPRDGLPRPPPPCAHGPDRGPAGGYERHAPRPSARAVKPGDGGSSGPRADACGHVRPAGRLRHT